MTADVVPLDPDEAVLWSGRPRLAAVAPGAVAGVVVVAGALLAAWAADDLRLALVGLLGVAVAVRSLLVVTNTAYLVTDRACYRKTGVLSRDVRRIGLERVQNSASRQGVRGALFGYGTVVVEAAGGGRIRFHTVASPGTVRSILDRRAGGSAVPGSVESWEAVLEEVRALRTALVDG